MSVMTKNWMIATLMLVASGLAMFFRPTVYLADTKPSLDLAQSIPNQFGTWQQLKQQAQIVNPQRQNSLNKFYAQTLSRTYVNDQGDMVMLSIAYGKDQSDDKQVHYPEACYPAQGFQVISNHIGLLETKLGTIRVKRLETKLRRRFEPITYWTTVGDKLTLTGYEAKKAQLAYGFKGYIPDGLIFRVSSINPDSAAAFKLQQRFVTDLIDVVDPDVLHALAIISS